jgi:hypothetical protein
MPNHISKYMSSASLIGLALIFFNVVLSIAYLLQKDYRRSLYFLFAAAITCTVVL